MKQLFSLIAVAAVATVFSYGGSNADLVKMGEKIFNDKKQGNCLACHDANGKKIDGPGSFGPKLQYLSQWPKEALYDKIYDPYTTNPISAMPPFGKNGILSDKQINALIAYLKTIN